MRIWSHECVTWKRCADTGVRPCPSSGRGNGDQSFLRPQSVPLRRCWVDGGDDVEVFAEIRRRKDGFAASGRSDRKSRCSRGSKPGIVSRLRSVLSSAFDELVQRGSTSIFTNWMR